MKLRHMLFALLFAMAPVQADPEPSISAKVMTPGFGEVLVTLHGTPCVLPSVTKHIPPQYRQLFKAGEGIVFGKKRELCWSMTSAKLPLAEGEIFIIDEEGSDGVVQAVDFAKDKPKAGPSKYEDMI